MTNAEKQEIIEAVLAALATNSKTIAQLSPKQSLIDSDLFEVAGGSRITFANLVASVLASPAYTAATNEERAQIWTAIMANFAATEANETPSGTDPSKINAMQSRIVLLDSMGYDLDGEGYVVKPGDWYFEKSSGYQIHLKNQSGATSFKASVGVLYVNKRTGKTYLWSSDEEDMIELSSPIHVVNDLVTGGEGDALSAEMGKVLKRNMLLTVAKVNELIGALAGIAFVGNPVSELSGLNWNSTAPHAMFASGSGQHLELSGTFSGSTWTGKISVKSADAASYGLPMADDVTAMMSGASKVITYYETTGDITITNMNNDVEITALATELLGTDKDGNKVRWRMGKYFSNDSSQTPTHIVQTSADGAFSDYIPVSFVAGDVLEFDLGKYCFVANDYTTNPYIEFYGSDKSYIGHIGMNSENARSWTVPSGNNVLNTAYIRVSAYVPRIGVVYVKKNDSYYLKGDNL